MKPIELTAQVDLQASAGGEGKKKPTAKILAYNGGQIRPPGWGYIVIDLEDAAIPDRLPILADHENRIEAMLGYGRPFVKDGKLFVEADLSEATPAGKTVCALARDGMQLQASVGFEPNPDKITRHRDGQTFQANGRTFTAPPASVALVSGRLKEVSICVIGADEDSHAAIAAQSDKGDATMGQQNETAEKIRAREAEPMRIRAIKALASAPEFQHETFPEGGAAFDSIQASAIADGLSVEATEAKMRQALPALKDLYDMRASRPEPFKTHIGGQGPLGDATDRSILASAVLLHAGLDGLAETAFGERAVNAADKSFRFSHLLDLTAATLRAAGRDVPNDRHEMIRAAFSSTNLPIALGAAGDKVLIDAYRATPATWEGFSYVKSAPNFREQTALRPSWVGNMEEVGADGELKHAALGEDTFPFQISTFGKLVKLTRQDVINDDLSLLQDGFAALGRMARRGLNDLVWTVIMANAGDHFHADNSNLKTGAGSALDTDAFDAAVTALRKQRDAQNNDLDLVPAVLAVPPELETTARAILESVEIQAAEGNPTGNARKGAAKLAVESRMSNTTKFANASTTAWYLFADASAVPVVVAFLNGKRTPTVEFMGLDQAVDTLGVAWRVYHDFGAALGDHRAAVKNNGA